ncbi:MAG TPA: hypothetical protein VKC34_07310, partial [Blastocatellia bacterium]|nr:hypothetical protein [Blastocatellia bacterium]
MAFYNSTIKITLTFLAVAMVLCVAGPLTSTTGKASVEASSSLRGRAREIARGSEPYNPNLILLNRGAIDTSTGPQAGVKASHASSPAPSQKQLRIVQFAGPIKSAWLDRLRATGVEIIGYVPNNAYIVRGHGPALARAARLNGSLFATDDRPIRW